MAAPQALLFTTENTEVSRRTRRRFLCDLSAFSVTSMVKDSACGAHFPTELACYRTASGWRSGWAAWKAGWASALAKTARKAG